MNRVGDMGLSIGFFALFALFGSLDYATIFSLVPFMNETAITIIGLLLLTGAMEGFKGVKHYILIIIYIIFFYIYSDHSYDLKYSSLLPIFSTVSTSTLHTIT